MSLLTLSQGDNGTYNGRGLLLDYGSVFFLRFVVGNVDVEVLFL